MLKKFNVTDYKYVQFEKDQTAPWLLYIVQYDSPSYIYKEEIGRFDFYNMEGKLAIPSEGMKEYKRFNAMLNIIFKHDERFGWNYVLVEDCKKSGLKKRKEEKAALAEKEANKQTEKALEYINKLNNNDTQLVNVLKENFTDVTDDQLIKVIKNNFKNAISDQLVNEVFNTIKTVLNNEINKQEGENENMLTNNEKEVISTRIGVNSNYDLNNSVFTPAELKEAKILSLINEHAEHLTNETILKNDNIDISNKTASQFNEKERYLYNFYYNNVLVSILDGSYSDIVNNVRSEYTSYINKLNHHIQVEKSFELPDYEVTLSIMIERSNRPENIIKAEHEKAIKEAIEKGYKVQQEVLKDYPHLKENETTNNDTISYVAYNRTFSTYAEAEAYCISNDFDTEYIKEVAPQQPSNNPVTYHFYKQTFSNYMDAYNYAINNKSSVTMVIASNHPYMTNERLQQLEKEYTFAKSNMSYSDMKEYFTYISSLNESLDQQERYYKLQSYIQRYEYKQQQKQNREEYLRDLMREACTLLHFMKKKGLQLVNKSDCGIHSTKYIYNDTVLHFDVRSNGMPIEDYSKMIHNIFNNHFSDYINEYKHYTLYWYYMPDNNTEPLTQIDSYVFTDNTIGEYGIIAYDRQLNDAELKYYNLTSYTPESTQQAI